MVVRFYQQPFFGLFLFISAHLFVIYYLAWMLLPHLHQQTISPFIEPYFPQQKYRAALPTFLLSVLTVYYFTVWVIRRMMLQEQTKVLASNKPNPPEEAPQ